MRRPRPDHAGLAGGRRLGRTRCLGTCGPGPAAARRRQHGTVADAQAAHPPGQHAPAARRQRHALPRPGRDGTGRHVANGCARHDFAYQPAPVRHPGHAGGRLAGPQDERIPRRSHPAAPVPATPRRRTKLHGRTALPARRRHGTLGHAQRAAPVRPPGTPDGRARADQRHHRTQARRTRAGPGPCGAGKPRRPAHGPAAGRECPPVRRGRHARADGSGAGAQRGARSGCRTSSP